MLQECASRVRRENHIKEGGLEKDNMNQGVNIHLDKIRSLKLKKQQHNHKTTALKMGIDDSSLL